MKSIAFLAILAAYSVTTAWAAERDFEAEYYANAYADHYGFRVPWCMPSSPRNQVGILKLSQAPGPWG